jgi:LacI family transcriptional regulator
VLAANDQMGIAALLALTAAGVAVPQRAMVTGFNGFAFRDYTDPVLTTVRSAAYEMGAAGADAVLARLAEGRFPDRDIRLPVALLPGGTTRDGAG